MSGGLSGKRGVKHVTGLFGNRAGEHITDTFLAKGGGGKACHKPFWQTLGVKHVTRHFMQQRGESRSAHVTGLFLQKGVEHVTGLFWQEGKACHKAFR